MASFRPSHYLVRRPDLRQAVSEYENAGFNVVWGSAPDVAHNALIYFDSGGFVELYGPRTGADGKARGELAEQKAAEGVILFKRFLRTGVRHLGFCEFALETDLVLGDALAEVDPGIVMSGPGPFSRDQADGVTTHWELSFPLEDEYLPFVMGPYDPPPRITPEQRAHANGIRSLAGFRLRHPEPAVYAKNLAAFLSDAKVEARGEDAWIVHADYTGVIEASSEVEHAALLSRDVDSVLELPGLRIEPA